MFTALKLFWGTNSLSITGILVLLLGVWIGSLELRLGIAKGNEADLSGQVKTLLGTIKETKGIGKAQEDRANRLEAGAHAAVLAQTNQSQTDLKKVEDYYVKKLSNSNVAHGVCFNTSAAITDSGEMPSKGTGSGVPDEGTSDKIPSGRSLEENCAITTFMLLKFQEHERSQQELYQ